MPNVLGSGASHCSQAPCCPQAAAGLALIPNLKCGITCMVHVELHNLAVIGLMEVAFDPNSGFM